MKKWGFTLIEAIIVVSIITVVMGAVFVSLNPTKRFGQSNDGRRWADLATISKAVDIYTADNGAAPSDFASSTVAVGMKVVLCDSSATLTCDGDTYGCLVVDDTSFLGTYLPAIPVDPSKTDASDSGYYMTRESSGAISFGSCSSYSGEDVKVISAINMTAYSVTCGDGLTQATEVCDDGDTFSEGCGNGVIETNGTYCNSTCSAVIVVGVSEVCDSLLIDSCWDSSSSQNLYSGSYVGGTGCKAPKTHCNAACNYCSAGCF